MRTQFVFRSRCGCPFGVVEGSYAGSPSRAFKMMYETQRERDAAIDRGVTVEHMSHERYTAEVYPQMLSGYRCPHGGAS